MKVSIVDVGLGNIGSIRRMLERVGAFGGLISTRKECMDSEALVLPGVGHFDEGMIALRKAGLVDAIRDAVCEAKVPILGICLGMQLLCRNSEEGSELGLGLIDAVVQSFRFPIDSKLKVPHMGWNFVHPKVKNPLVSSIEGGERFYFVHSYRVVPSNPNVIVGVADYGGEFCAAIRKENIFGVQFHPEKSHRFGMELMKRFSEIKSCKDIVSFRRCCCVMGVW